MKMIVCGDIALCRETERMVMQGRAEQIAGDLRERLIGAEVFLANLECPLTDSTKPRWSYFPTLKGSRSVGLFLGQLGVNVVSLANNHIADYGKAGLSDTISVLEGQGIAWLGAGFTVQEANQPLTLERSGVRLGIMALAQPEISAATKAGWGAAVLEDRSALTMMKNLKRKVDFAIAYLHFGVEFSEYPTPHQIWLSRNLVEAGAGLVLGHHSHTAQGYEYYRDGFIAYGLGNFIFDMPPDPRKRSRLGILLQVDVDGKKLRNVEVIPVETSCGKTTALDGRNRFETDRYLGEVSEVLKNNIELKKIYYRICLENFRIHLHSLVHYSARRLDVRRMLSWASAQGWPQLRELRRDLVRFMISGEALEYEKKRKPQSKEWPAVLWKIICLSFFIVGVPWGKRLSHERYLQKMVPEK